MCHISFKARFVPPNKFKVGMKLEIRDPRSDKSYVLASVIKVVGCRLFIHPDGTEAGFGVWRMPDSGDIHPVGWCEGTGGHLTLPYGKILDDYTKLISFKIC